MTEILIYTAVGIVLYFAADAALRFIESMHGEPIPHRSIIFFGIILVMAIISFQIIKMMFLGEAPV
jgi:hypothetical protein